MLQKVMGSVHVGRRWAGIQGIHRPRIAQIRTRRRPGSRIRRGNGRCAKRSGSRRSATHTSFDSASISICSQYHVICKVSADRQSGRVVEMHPIHGPLHHQLPAQDELQTEMNMIRDCNSLCTVVDVGIAVKILADNQINNKMKLRPEPFLPLSREFALAHYAKYPIKDHVQSVPPINTTIVSIEGEPVWTSVKPLAELQELLVKDLLWPKRHVGESGRRNTCGQV